MGRRWPAPRGGWRGGGRGGGRGVADVGRAVDVRALECVHAGGARACRWPRGQAQRSVRARRGARGPFPGADDGLRAPHGRLVRLPRDPGPTPPPGLVVPRSARALEVCNSCARSNLSRLAVPQEPVGPLWPGFPGPFCTSATRSFVSASLEVPASSPKPFPRPLTQEGTVQKGCDTSKGSPMLDTVPSR